MKKTFITFISVVCLILTANAQSNDFAELRDEVLYFKDGTVLKEGDILVLENATGCYENCFENIFHEPTEAIPKLTNKFTKNVYANYSGYKTSIKKIKQITKNKEKIWLVTLYYSPKRENIYCYIEKALSAGEIVIEKVVKQEIKIEKPVEVIKETVIEKNIEKPVEIIKETVIEKNPATVSVADEIRKLKALCDEGIITKEEFEKQKSKLLE